jgi:hypothetical protein
MVQGCILGPLNSTAARVLNLVKEHASGNTGAFADQLVGLNNAMVAAAWEESKAMAARAGAATQHLTSMITLVVLLQLGPQRLQAMATLGVSMACEAEATVTEELVAAAAAGGVVDLATTLERAIQRLGSRLSITVEHVMKAKHNHALMVEYDLRVAHAAYAQLKVARP